MFTSIDVAYSYRRTLSSPVILSLPRNGLRLRFDGLDQRLRLIEVTDFSKIHLTYKGNELVKAPDQASADFMESGVTQPGGPAFRSVYHKLFGPTFPGEYFPPPETGDKAQGTYVLSYPGVAFCFSVQHSSWSGNSDSLSILSSSAATSARSLAIFNGSSWKDARSDLLTRSCPYPRSINSIGHGRETSPDEVEIAIVKGGGIVELRRRSLPSFNLVLGETTPQDLVAQLGPPDAIYRKNDRRLSIHKARTSSRTDHPPMLSGSPGQVGSLSDTDRSSISTTTDYSSPDEDLSIDSTKPSSATEYFYNYFRHGFDVFVTYASSSSPELDPVTANDTQRTVPALPTGYMVATKILFHANVPGSYAFSRYRRSRWCIDTNGMETTSQVLDSETPFSTIKPALNQIRKDSDAHGMKNSAFQKHMVLNRGWGDSPGSSCELLGSWEDGSENSNKGQGQSAILSNTELHGFPGLLFEVLKNGAVSCLTVY